MRTLREKASFKRDLKRIKKSGLDCIADVEHVVALLLNDVPLPEHMRDHALSGAWKKIQARECHVKPDLLLIYSKPENILRLLRLGSHSELF
jgi:mRNA interferase YafQ